MRDKVLLNIRLCLVVFTILGVNAAVLRLRGPGSAVAASSGHEVIDAVNQIRSANGLAPYKVDSALMAAAQGHSEYMAESGSVSHTGAGGSDPASRAAAAGYNGSGVSENIMSGSNLSAAQAVGWWQSDSAHLSTLLLASGEDAGAGVAVSDDTVYYTLEVGHKGSGSGSSAVSKVQPAATGSAAVETTPSTPEVSSPVETQTPGPDGSILHTVKEGQTIWDIAAAYNVRLADLYALNGLTDASVIFPGERLIIRLPDKTITPAAQTTGTPVSGTPQSGTPASESAQPSATPRPATRTPVPTTTQAAPTENETSSSPSSEPTAAASETPAPTRPGIDPILILIGALALVGASLVVLGTFLKRVQ